MDRIVILGADSPAGEALVNQLADKFHVTGLWFEQPVNRTDIATSRIDQARLEKEIQLADTVYFCGGASRSSWDAGFGNFTAEEQWLAACVDRSAEAGAGLIYVSSDAAFNGPWVFHDDDAACDLSCELGAKLHEMEELVASHPDHLIIRTNVVGMTIGRGHFVDDVLSGLQNGQVRRIPADTFSTPISEEGFALAAAECGMAETAGVINVGGAERTTPFRFASLLARQLGHDTDLLAPAIANGPTSERSLRCSRLRCELNIAAPLLSETIEQVCAGIVERTFHAAAA